MLAPHRLVDTYLRMLYCIRYLRGRPFISGPESLHVSVHSLDTSAKRMLEYCAMLESSLSFVSSSFLLLAAHAVSLPDGCPVRAVSRTEHVRRHPPHRWRLRFGEVS